MDQNTVSAPEYQHFTVSVDRFARGLPLYYSGLTDFLTMSLSLSGTQSEPSGNGLSL